MKAIVFTIIWTWIFNCIPRVFTLDQERVPCKRGGPNCASSDDSACTWHINENQVIIAIYAETWAAYKIFGGGMSFYVKGRRNSDHVPHRWLIKHPNSRFTNLIEILRGRFLRPKEWGACIIAYVLHIFLFYIGSGLSELEIFLTIFKIYFSVLTLVFVAIPYLIRQNIKLTWGYRPMVHTFVNNQFEVVLSMTNRNSVLGSTSWYCTLHTLILFIWLPSQRRLKSACPRARRASRYVLWMCNKIKIYAKVEKSIWAWNFENRLVKKKSLPITTKM